VREYGDAHGYGWMDILFAEHGLTHNDIVEGDNVGWGAKYKLVDGLTKRYKNFSGISIIFGIAEQYRDPSF